MARLPGPRHELVRSPDSPLASVERTCLRIAGSDSTVLLTGETGTGKEVFARLIHEASPRAGKLLVPVNCGAIPEALLESELFGHARGAFTGANVARRGRIAAADGGTLFLDEIGELPLSLQVKLLRVLQERCYEPVGSTQPVAADFRLITATNRDLAAEVEAGRFRRDLYFRLVVCPVELPPLRQRRCDVAALFRHFWERRGETRPVDRAVLAALEAHDWPGNVRELENLAERLSVCAEGPSIRLQDLPAPLRALAGAPVAAGAAPEPEAAEVRGSHDAGAPAVEAAPAVPAAEDRPAAADRPAAEDRPATADDSAAAGASANQDAEPAPVPAPAVPVPVPPRLPVDLPKMLRELEERFIELALAQAGGNKRAAADLLGLQRTTLVEKLRRRQTPSVA